MKTDTNSILVRKVTLSLLVVFSFIICIFLYILYVDHTKPVKFDLASAELNTDVVYYISKIKKKDYFKINDCWAFLPGETIHTFDTNLVLKNEETGVAYKIPSTFVMKDSINENYPSEFDYSKSGFKIKIPAKYFDFKNNTYRVYIYYNNNEHNYLVQTDIII